MKILLIFALTLFVTNSWAKEKVFVGSKTFTESYILGEIITQIINDTGELEAIHKVGLGNSGIVFEALKTGSIDFYPEYTGTLSETLLKDPTISTIADIRKVMQSRFKLTISDSLGFNNTYAIGLLRKRAEELNIDTISDLKKFPELRAGFSNPFMHRLDCLPKIRKTYGLPLKNAKALEHGIIYEALTNNQIDLVDAYATDAKIRKHDLYILRDDKRAFPSYWAVITARMETIQKYPKTWQALRAIENRIDASEMTRLNSLVELEGKNYRQAAAEFLQKSPDAYEQSKFADIIRHTKRHAILVFVSLIAAILVGVPIAIVARNYPLLGQTLLTSTGIIQTIPSLALLCFFVRPFGIGVLPALIALALYGLLPIARSAYVGLISIDSKLLEVADAMGLNRKRRLWSIEIPLASQAILGGVKISAITTVGTATLAALIGAGGYGEPIVTGLSMNDMSVVLLGAIPATVFALVVHGLFEGIDRLLVPRGLR